MKSPDRVEPFEPFRTAFDLSKYLNAYEAKRAEILEGFLPQGRGELALDIGSGPGYFSRLLTDRGWKAVAIDTDTANIESARNYAEETHLGPALNVLQKMPGNRYDLVLALEIIEHMPKMRGELLLNEILKVLKPGGKLILSTPNKFSPEGLWDYCWSEKIRKKKWEAWDETHVHIYSSMEIIRLVKSSGFVVDGITGYYYEGSLPFGKRFRLPFTTSRAFPLNRLGFNIIMHCHKK